MKTTKEKILQRCDDILKKKFPANGREVEARTIGYNISCLGFGIAIHETSSVYSLEKAEFLLGMDQPPAEVDKLAFGIEIVSAMKASAYGVSIEQGRSLALEGTESDENMSHQHKMFVENERRRLHEQAVFVAEIALEYLSTPKP